MQERHFTSNKVNTRPTGYFIERSYSFPERYNFSYDWHISKKEVIFTTYKTKGLKSKKQ